MKLYEDQEPTFQGTGSGAARAHGVGCCSWKYCRSETTGHGIQIAEGNPPELPPRMVDFCWKRRPIFSRSTRHKLAGTAGRGCWMGVTRDGPCVVVSRGGKGEAPFAAICPEASRWDCWRSIGDVGRAQLSARAQSRSPAVEQMRVVAGSGRLAYVVGGRLRG